ncbi:MAG: hypothetical protein MK086_11525 [Flavobacteriales bacterium]|nr:hypothetical protein [Flavobacteriales bacterium]
MIDLGKSIYEETHRFERISVRQILINPKIRNYPDLFLVCREIRNGKVYEYLIGLELRQLNQILMRFVENTDRIPIAERCCDFLISKKQTGEISLNEAIGKPLEISGFDLVTKVKMFSSEVGDNVNGLYYFQLLDL